MPKKPSDWDGWKNITANVPLGWGRGYMGSPSALHFIRTAWPGVLFTYRAFIWKAQRVPPSSLMKPPAALSKGPEQEFIVKDDGRC